MRPGEDSGDYLLRRRRWGRFVGFRGHVVEALRLEGALDCTHDGGKSCVKQLAVQERPDALSVALEAAVLKHMQALRPPLATAAAVKAAVRSDTLLGRAWEIIYTADRFSDIEFQGEWLQQGTAHCQGSSQDTVYNVTVGVFSNTHFECSCSCPFVEDKKNQWCKHSIALLLLRTERLRQQYGRVQSAAAAPAGAEDSFAAENKATASGEEDLPDSEPAAPDGFAPNPLPQTASPAHKASLPVQVLTSPEKRKPPLQPRHTPRRARKRKGPPPTPAEGKRNISSSQQCKRSVSRFASWLEGKEKHGRSRQSRPGRGNPREVEVVDAGIEDFDLEDHVAMDGGHLGSGWSSDKQDHGEHLASAGREQGTAPSTPEAVGHDHEESSRQSERVELKSAAVEAKPAAVKGWRRIFGNVSPIPEVNELPSASADRMWTLPSVAEINAAMQQDPIMSAGESPADSVHSRSQQLDPIDSGVASEGTAVLGDSPATLPVRRPVRKRLLAECLSSVFGLGGVNVDRVTNMTALEAPQAPHPTAQHTNVAAAVSLASELPQAQPAQDSHAHEVVKPVGDSKHVELGASEEQKPKEDTPRKKKSLLERIQEARLSALQQ
eukprot:jgi/Chlat1/7265/Chrsp58S06900